MISFIIFLKILVDMTKGKADALPLVKFSHSGADLRLTLVLGWTFRQDIGCIKAPILIFARNYYAGSSFKVIGHTTRKNNLHLTATLILHIKSKRLLFLVDLVILFPYPTARSLEGFCLALNGGEVSFIFYVGLCKQIDHQTKKSDYYGAADYIFVLHLYFTPFDFLFDLLNSFIKAG